MSNRSVDFQEVMSRVMPIDFQEVMSRVMPVKALDLLDTWHDLRTKEI